MGTSQWDLDDSRSCDHTAGGYHGAPVAGSRGTRAPGIALHFRCWNVRTPVVTIG